MEATCEGEPVLVLDFAGDVGDLVVEEEAEERVGGRAGVVVLLLAGLEGVMVLVLRPVADGVVVVDFAGVLGRAVVLEEADFAALLGVEVGLSGVVVVVLESLLVVVELLSLSFVVGDAAAPPVERREEGLLGALRRAARAACCCFLSMIPSACMI